MRIAVLTRTGRLDGYPVTSAVLAMDNHEVLLIAERRSSLVKDRLKTVRLRDVGMFELAKKVVAFGRGVLTEFVNRRGSFSALANRFHDHVLVVDNHNDAKCHRRLLEFQPDVIVISNTRYLKAHVLATARISAINVHNSTLPKYAGLAPIFWALYHDERHIGVTIHVLEKVIDAGAILAQETITVEPSDNEQTLDRKTGAVSARLIRQTLVALEDGTVTPSPQDLSQRSYFSMPTALDRKELKRRLKQRRLQSARGEPTIM